MEVVALITGTPSLHEMDGSLGSTSPGDDSTPGPCLSDQDSEHIAENADTDPNPTAHVATTDPSTLSTERVHDEKLNQFVDFLYGVSSAASTFQAQMKLSMEGCQKLSKFIETSNRVRSLSLANNLIGELQVTTHETLVHV